MTKKGNKNINHKTFRKTQSIKSKDETRTKTLTLIFIFNNRRRTTMGLNRCMSNDMMTQGTNSISSSGSDDDLVVHSIPGTTMSSTTGGSGSSMISPTSTSRTRKGLFSSLTSSCSSESKSISNSPPSHLLTSNNNVTTSSLTSLSSATSSNSGGLTTQHSADCDDNAALPSFSKLRLSRTTSSPYDLRLSGLLTNPVPLRLDGWSEPCSTHFKVRDVGYTSNRNKKVPSLESVFHLLTVDIIQSLGQPNYSGMCGHPTERVQLALEQERLTGIPQLPEFIFAVNLCIPATCASSDSTTKSKQNNYYHVVFYFGLDNINMIKDMNTPLGRVANPFFFGTAANQNEFRDKTFKLIPKIVEGNFVVRKAVGTKPSILGSKVKQHYIMNERYFELIVDISSDMIANQMVKLALGYSKNLVVDMMFLLEGHDETMLPERILGGVQMQNIDFRNNHDAPRVVAVLLP